MTNIRDIRLSDILPPNIAKDPKVSAAAQALDNELQALTAAVDQCLILSRINELPEPVLDRLAWQFHVDFYDPTLSIEHKRELVRNSLSWHIRKGTPAAVEELITTIFGNGKVQEWFEYGGEPYKFRLQVEVDSQGVTEEMLSRLERLIQNTKNTRSWLEVINIFLTGRCKLFLPCNTVGGEEVTIYPWSMTELEGEGIVRIGVGYQVVETTTIYPIQEV